MDQDESNYYLKYDALADTTEIKDITSDEKNAKILRRLKNNDASFERVWLFTEHEEYEDDEDDFVPSTKDELGWLGYYIGKSTALKKLNCYDNYDGIEAFCRGVNRNRSIKEIHFSGNLSDGSIFQMLTPFFEYNSSLTEISFENCYIKPGCCHQFPLALGRCQNSLKSINFSANETHEQDVVGIIVSLSMHPQLEELHLVYMDIGRNECMALSTLLKCTVTNLRTLSLARNAIDDEVIEIVAGALASNTCLRDLDLNDNNIGDRGVDAISRALQGNTTLSELNLGDNGTITIKGLKSLAALLRNNNCCLKELHLHDNDMGDEGARIFAEALASNSNLKRLNLHNNSITTEGWSAFGKLLCDTSSVNKTHLSNHTLEFVTPHDNYGLPSNVWKYLTRNKGTWMKDKTEIAKWKIIDHHSHFSMQPLFEWDFKVLPRIIDWFTKVSDEQINRICEKGLSTFGSYNASVKMKMRVRRMKLDCIFQFIRGMPMLYIEARTKKELEGIRCKRITIERS